MKQTFEFISDPGHAWLRVPVKLLEDWDIDILISEYSYRTREFAYLEEDCDAAIFINEAKKRNYEYKIVEKYIEDFDSYLKNKFVHRFNNNIRTA
jgi:hypothetical protein